VGVLEKFRRRKVVHAIVPGSYAGGSFGYYTCRLPRRVSAENADGAQSIFMQDGQEARDAGKMGPVLASGSSRQREPLELDGAGLLIDIGLGPRQLARRLQEIGSDWQRIRGVVLTHTHSDHWSARSLARLAELRVPFFCHAEHLRPLNRQCPEFQSLQFCRVGKDIHSGADF